MNSLKILVTSLIFVLISVFPAFLFSQENKKIIPGFYKINGKDFFCTEKYHDLAIDLNRLKFCQNKLNNCSKINSKNDNIINLCESSKNNLVQQLSICDSVNSQKDNIVRIHKLDNENLKKENEKLRDLAKSNWYESPFLWFAIGFSASIGVGYIYKL